MAFQDWPPELQEVYLNAVAFTWVADPNIAPQDWYTAENLFEYGWVTMPGQTQEVRETFYAFTGTDGRDIDWYAWKQFWGYT